MKNVKLTDLEVAQYFANKARNGEPYCAPVVVEGTVTLKKGTYTGQLLGERPHGTGTLTTSKGEKFTGHWSHGMKHGLIVHTKANGKTVTEAYNNDKLDKEAFIRGLMVAIKNEYGVEEYYGELEDGGYAEGSFITTEVKNKDYTEKGLFIASNKESVLMYGQRVYNDGTVLSIGYTPMVQKRSISTSTLYGEAWTGFQIYDNRENGVHFEGYCFRERFIIGKKVKADNTCYEGEFKDGNPYGKGVLTLADGTRLEGLWRAGELNGDVKVTKTDGTVWKYVFIDGKPISHTKIEQEQQ